MPTSDNAAFEPSRCEAALAALTAIVGELESRLVPGLSLTRVEARDRDTAAGWERTVVTASGAACRIRIGNALAQGLSSALRGDEGPHVPELRPLLPEEELTLALTVELLGSKVGVVLTRALGEPTFERAERASFDARIDGCGGPIDVLVDPDLLGAISSRTVSACVGTVAASDDDIAALAVGDVLLPAAWGDAKPAIGALLVDGGPRFHVELSWDEMATMTITEQVATEMPGSLEIRLPALLWAPVAVGTLKPGSTVHAPIALEVWHQGEKIADATFVEVAGRVGVQLIG